MDKINPDVREELFKASWFGIAKVLENSFKIELSGRQVGLEVRGYRNEDEMNRKIIEKLSEVGIHSKIVTKKVLVGTERVTHYRSMTTDRGTVIPLESESYDKDLYEYRDEIEYSYGDELRESLKCEFSSGLWDLLFTLVMNEDFFGDSMEIKWAESPGLLNFFNDKGEKISFKANTRLDGQAIKDSKIEDYVYKHNGKYILNNAYRKRSLEKSSEEKLPKLLKRFYGETFIYHSRKEYKSTDKNGSCLHYRDGYECNDSELCELVLKLARENESLNVKKVDCKNKHTSRSCSNVLSVICCTTVMVVIPLCWICIPNFIRNKMLCESYMVSMA